MGPDPGDLESIERYLRDRLTQPLPGAAAHLRMAPRPGRPDWRPDDLPSVAHRAAVLILLYPGLQGVTMPLTVRHSSLPHHPGQISLPGGRIDLDETAEHAALREAQEEIGVHPDRVRVAGPLSTLWVMVSNHVVQPFVGVTDRRPDFVLAAREVEALVEMPVQHLLDEARVGFERRVRDGLDIEVPYFDVDGQRIWGATGMVLGELREILSFST